MAFSLSPAVTVKEINISQNVPNIPSARTGMVLRATTGPCLTPTGITTEAELVSTFGKPTIDNYQDWFQAWNFLQYSSSLYLVRPVPKDASNNNYKNAGIFISGNATTETNAELFNTNTADTYLDSLSVTGKLAFFNKFVEAEQKLGIAVCSNPAYWDKQITSAYSSVVSSIADSSSTIAVTNNSLVKGSKFLSKGTGKIYEVIAATPSSVTVNATFGDVDTKKKELMNGYIVYTASTSGVSFTLTSTDNNAKVGQVFTVGAKLAYVTGIVTSGGISTITLATADGLSLTPASTGTVYTESEAVWFSLDAGYQAADLIPAGSTSIALQPGFYVPEGYVFTLATNNLTASITSAVESDSAYTVIAVDSVNNVVYLDAPLATDVTSLNGVLISTALTFLDVDPVDSMLTGINLFDQKFDGALIKKTRLVAKYAADGATAVNKPYIKEELVLFSDMAEYTPNWENGEFLTIVLKKNDDNLYELGETILSSYNATARNTDGRSIFADNIFFTGSKYLYAKVGSGVQVNSYLSLNGLFTFTANTETNFVFTDYNQASVQFAFEEFADPESFDINILVAHQLDMNYASTIAESRRDCVAIVAPYTSSDLITKSASEATKFINERFGSRVPFDEKVFNTFGTYSAVYGNMKYQYDKYNDVNRWLCVAGDIAGLYAQTDNTRDTWWAPAGSERGIMKNAIKLAFNPNKQNRDDLYVNAINPIISIPGEGSGVVYGQKTATAISSAMDRVNVRRLLIFLEKSIATSAKTGLFEFNDAFTRQRLFSMIDPFLRNVQSRRGLYDYKLVIDESNNNAEIIDGNGLVIDVYLKPSKSVEFIQVSAIIVKTGTSFTEVVGKV